MKKTKEEKKNYFYLVETKTTIQPKYLINFYGFHDFPFMMAFASYTIECLFSLLVRISFASFFFFFFFDFRVVHTFQMRFDFINIQSKASIP